METLRYEIEFITPAFIGGADPTTAELRPSSIVGMLRYWFRVIAGAFVKDTNELFKLEAELFGSSERAGKVWVRVRGNVKKSLVGCESWKAAKESDRDWGKVYLGYGNILFINFGHKNPKKREKFIEQYKKLYKLCGKRPIKGNFTVKGYLLRKAEAVLEILVPKGYKDRIDALLYIVSKIGGLGSRSRRGWGSFYLSPEQGKSCFNSWDFWDAEELKFAIEKLNPLQENGNVIEIYRLPHEYSEPMEALENIGRIYRRFRSRRQPDYDNIKNFLSGHITKNALKDEGVKRAYFGMPITFRFRSLNNATVEVKTENGRFSSPVIFRIVKLKNGKYTSLIIHVKSLLKPNKIRITGKGKDVYFSTLDEQIFYEFVKKEQLIREVTLP